MKTWHKWTHGDKEKLAEIIESLSAKEDALRAQGVYYLLIWKRFGQPERTVVSVRRAAEKLRNKPPEPVSQPEPVAPAIPEQLPLSRGRWSHLSPSTAHGMCELEQVAQLASESPTESISIAGQALASDLDSVERWTRFLTKALKIENRKVKP